MNKEYIMASIGNQSSDGVHRILLAHDNGIYNPSRMGGGFSRPPLAEPRYLDVSPGPQEPQGTGLNELVASTIEV